MENLDYDVFSRFVESMDRYLELEPDYDEEKINTANLHINYAISDINNLIERFEPQKPDLGIYYQMLIKTDFLISIIEFFYMKFEGYPKRETKKRIEMIFNDEKGAINQFRLLRSLTLAHPIETTGYEDLGYGKNNNKWCEDVIPKSGIHSFFTDNLKDADFILKIKERGNSLTISEPIYLEKDIISVARIVIKHLGILADKIELKLQNKIEELKKQKIYINKGLKIEDYIMQLKSELKIRFPREVEYYESVEDKCHKIKHDDCHKIIEHSILDDALEIVKIEFKDKERNIIFEKYRKSIIHAVHYYGNGMQNMNIKRERDKLNGAILPDPTKLESESQFEKAHYMHEKISMYLFRSEGKSVNEAKRKLEEYTYDGCKQVGICSDTEWGVIQLLLLKDEIQKYFPLDLDVSDKLLFAQYCAALHIVNNIS